ncbi:MAG: hypothetical protein ACM3PF_03975 [Bacteroidota bacterium]
MKRIWILAALTLAAAPPSAWARSGGTTSSTTNTIRGVETRLETTVSTVNSDATRVGGATFTDRLATDLGVTADVLTQERTQFNVGFGDLLVAYSIQSASKTSVTIDQIMQMRASGQSWTAIARSLQIAPGRLMRSVTMQASSLSSTSSTGGSGTGTTSRSTSGSGSTTRNATFSGSGRTGAITGVDRQIDTRIQSFDDATSRLGDPTMVETRLAQDLGVTTDVLTQQETQYNATLGDLLVAYTIQSDARTSVTLDEIFTMRSSGETWTQIARAFRIPPGTLLRGIRTETQTLSSATSGSGSTSGTTTTTTTRTHGKGATAASQMHGKGGTAAVGTTLRGHGGATLSTGTTTRLSTTTTLLHGQGALMRANASGALRGGGHK